MTLFFWFLICLALSAFFSGAEMAFVSGDTVRLREEADSGSRAARRVVHMHNRQHEFLTTLLVGNNIANVTATSIFTYFLSSRLGIQSEWLVTLVMTPLLLIFGEIIPKDYCRLHSHSFMLSASAFLAWLSRFLKIITLVIMKAVDLFLGPLGSGQRKSIFVSEQEFRSLIEESMRTGVVKQHEKKIIDTILDFERTLVESVMTPVDKVPKVELHATIEDVKQIARETGAKMLLVYEEIPSIVVGMIYVFDVLFEEKNQAGLSKFLRSPVFINQNTSNEMAFFTLQQRRQSYAVVVDPSQEVAGVVAIERLLAF